MTIWEIAQKIVVLLDQRKWKKLERKHKVLKILKSLGISELEKDVELVYIHTLVEYAVGAEPAELTLLFAAEPIKQAFQQAPCKSQTKAFEKDLDDLLASDKIPIVTHMYKTPAELKPEIHRFQELYEHFTKKSTSSFELMEYNELHRLVMKSLEKSFDHQAEQYLKRLKQDFQREFLDNNFYIDLNGEIRKEKKGKEALTGTEPPGKKEIEEGNENETGEKRTDMSFESVVYKPLDRFIHEWLKDENGNLLVILGEYGTGKTTFLRHLAHRLGVHWLEPGVDEDAPDEKYRMPLYFPLRDFEKQMETFIVDQFSKERISDIDFPGFLRRMVNDEFVVLLDGFDEMTRKVDPDEKHMNFDKIRRLIDSSNKSKIILTVRMEYFQSDADIEAVFQHRDKSNYQFAHLLSFDDGQIRKYLESHTSDPEYYWGQIQTVFDLYDLAKRPVLLQLIVDYLPKVITDKGKNEPIAASDLYDKCIREELRRKSSKLDFIIPNEYRVEILEKLAVWMFLNEQLTVDTKFLGIRRLLRRYFNIDMEWEYEKYLNEFLTFSFLIREGNFHYRISHKSFRDYLTARAFVHEINTGKIEHFAGNRITQEIIGFIIEQKPDVETLSDLVLNARIENLSEKNQWQGTNAVNILLKIDKTFLKNRDLSRCRLASVDFGRCDLINTIFYDADLSDCLFNRTVLWGRFRNINATNSRLDLSWSDLTDISFLKEFRNLSSLDLYANRLTDISALKELKSLTILNLGSNKLKDISALGELKNLTILNLSFNHLTDISAIKELKNLIELYLHDNELTDVSALKELKNLEHLYLHNNPLPKDQTDALKEALPNLKSFGL